MDGKPAVVLHPVGRLDKDEVDAIVSRARKAIGLAIEMGRELSTPPGATDSARSQIVASKLLATVPAIVEAPPPPPTYSTYGGEGAAAQFRPAPAAGPPAAPPAPGSPAGGAPTPSVLTAFVHVAVVDGDIYSPGQEFLFRFAEPKGRRAVMALKRLREAFYRRKADPARQKARAAREFIAAVGAARGLPPCEDPRCVMWDARSVMEIDRKDDRFCGSCNNYIRGRMRW